MIERFTDRARYVLSLAQHGALSLNHGHIGTEHLLLGLVNEGEGVAARAIESFAIPPEAVRSAVEEISPPGRAASARPLSFTPGFKRVLERSLRESQQLQHVHIGTEHLLLGLVHVGEGAGALALESLGVDAVLLRQRVVALLGVDASGRALPRPDPEPDERSPVVTAFPGEVIAAGPGAEPAPFEVVPGELVTRADVEAVLREAARTDRTVEMGWLVGTIEHRSCDFQPGLLPIVTVSVAGASVTREGFDTLTAATRRTAVGDLGDAADIEASSGAVRVLSGGTVFSVTVRRHHDGRAIAIALARKALERLRDRS